MAAISNRVLLPLDLAHRSDLISPAILGEIKSVHPGEIVGNRTRGSTGIGLGLWAATKRCLLATIGPDRRHPIKAGAFRAPLLARDVDRVAAADER